MGEYLPLKQFAPEIVGPRGFVFIIILSWEYIIPYIAVNLVRSYFGYDLLKILVTLKTNCWRFDFRGSNGAFLKKTPESHELQLSPTQFYFMSSESI